MDWSKKKEREWEHLLLTTAEGKLSLEDFMSRRAVVQIVSNSNFFLSILFIFFSLACRRRLNKIQQKICKKKILIHIFSGIHETRQCKISEEIVFTRNNSNQLIMFLKDFPLFLLSLSLFLYILFSNKFPNTSNTSTHKLFTLFALNLFLGWVYGTENNSVWSWTRLPALWKNCHICEKLLLLLREIIFALWIFSMCISLKHSKDIHMIILLTMMKTIMWKAE